MEFDCIMNIIDLLYRNLESKSDFDILSVDTQNATDMELSIIEMENLAFLPISVFQDKTRNRQKDLKLAAYYDQRIKSTNNLYLLARYSHLLYLLTHQMNWCSVAVNSYKAIIGQNISNEDKAYFVVGLIDFLIHFSVEQEKLRVELKNTIINYLEKGNKLIVMYLGELLRKKYDSYFKISQISFFPERCYLFAKNDNEYIVCKRLLENGLFYANKDIKTFRVLVSKFYELLGDNEYKGVKQYDKSSENIIVPHQNQAIFKQMMEYYHKSGNQDKYNYAVKLYEENKKNLRFINLSYQVKQDSVVSEFLHNHFDNIKNFAPSMICLYLCLGDSFVFMPNKSIEEGVNKITTEHNFFKQMLYDINFNEKELVDIEWNKTRLYETHFNNMFGYLSSVILLSVESQKLSYTELKEFLCNHTCLGSKLDFKYGDTTISYTWFSQIDNALKDLFEQFSNIINNKSFDFQISIDILAIKFEGILRDIMNLTGCAITKINDRGGTTSGLLDFLFKKQDDFFNAGFNVDDLNLFKYVHTDKGLNIRNNVAHSFYIPQDYTLKKAILVFLCVLRLAKAKI